MKKTLSLFAAALLLGACTKDLDIDFDDMEPDDSELDDIENGIDSDDNDDLN